MRSHQREVFPGLDSGPNYSEGHYFYALKKRPSGDSAYTTKRFVCLVRYKILKVLYIMMTKETKGHRDAAVSILMAENSNKTNNREQKRAGI